MFITCDFYPSFLPGDSLDNACFQERLGSFDDDEPSHPGLAVSARLSGENHEVIQSNVSALENWYCEYVKMRKAEGADIGFKSMEGLASCLRYCCS